MRPIIQKKLKGLIFAASFAVLLNAEAQSVPQAADRAEAIDMDAEVIERESKTSPLRLEVETSALDSTIYKRSDFNEFHAVDSVVRLRYLAAPVAEPELGASK